MEAKHTPGKWQIGSGFIKQERKDGQKVVRIVAPHPEGGGQDIAECLECNSQLIAASPDMYDALKYAKEIIGIAKRYFPKSLKNGDKYSLLNLDATISKAIRKAEGEE